MSYLSYICLLLKGKSAEEIRNIFNIKNDFQEGAKKTEAVEAS